jgi:uncharacterized lipoprotein YajG
LSASINLGGEVMFLTKKIFVLAGIYVLLSGCAHHYDPKSTTFTLDAIHEFTSSHTITLVNANTSDEKILYATNMGHKFYGNPKNWTEAAMAITSRELSSRGMKVSEGANKSLKMTVESMKGTFGAFVIRCEMDLKVETGDGYVKTYRGDNRSPATLYRAVDGAVMRSVTQMLRDEKIIAYLTK